MTLLEQWRSNMYSETANKGDLQRLWTKYFDQEEAIYAEINKLRTKKVSSKILEKAPKTVIKKEETEKKLIDREKSIIALLINQKAYEQIKQEISVEDFKSEINKMKKKKNRNIISDINSHF